MRVDWGGNPTYEMTGMIDEGRIAKVRRSSSWFATEYANQSSPETFVGVGAEQQGSDPRLTRSPRSRGRRVFADRTRGRCGHAFGRFTRVTGSKIVDNLIDPGPARLIEFEDSSGNEIVGNILDRGDVGIALFGASTQNLVLRNVIAANASSARLPISARSRPGDRVAARRTSALLHRRDVQPTAVRSRATGGPFRPSGARMAVRVYAHRVDVGRPARPSGLWRTTCVRDT